MWEVDPSGGVWPLLQPKGQSCFPGAAWFLPRAASLFTSLLL